MKGKRLYIEYFSDRYDLGDHLGNPYCHIRFIECCCDTMTHNIDADKSIGFYVDYDGQFKFYHSDQWGWKDWMEEQIKFCPFCSVPIVLKKVKKK